MQYVLPVSQHSRRISSSVPKAPAPNASLPKTAGASQGERSLFQSAT